MAAQRTAKTEAFVLKKKSITGRDTVVTLFTREMGKVAVVAKGIRKITSRRLPHMETGNLINAVLYRRGEWHYLQETSLVSMFSGIKGDRTKVSLLYFFLFILDRILPEHQAEEPVYQLLKKFVAELSRTKAPGTPLAAKYVHLLLSSLGYEAEEKSLAEMVNRIEGLIDEKVPFPNI